MNQGGVDIVANGRYDLTPETRVALKTEYLSSYVYKLVFNDNYLQAVNSEVHSTISITHAHDGYVPSAYLELTCRTSRGANQGDEVRITPPAPACVSTFSAKPLHTSPFDWRMGSSLSYLRSRSEYGFHVRNLGRFDFYPHLSLPLAGGGWSITPRSSAPRRLSIRGARIRTSRVRMVAHLP